ncbi:MAG: MnhB domain-containing protein [Halomonas sp.]|uniref:MnhB domain-containing protein n=1 Tax=Halomonas sp. TaxID=1486246 RepID=UPI002ACD41AD|nr:MnhB domain-containing protein [Halomonas sp.]MDZ7852581.1 MnhB domain-containing protein [Halomonas sp.]
MSVLFIATAGVGFLLRRQGPAVRSGADGVPAVTEAGPGQGPSEILHYRRHSILVPVVALFGVYIFTHGHLTPGGGFQGGVILVSALLLLLSRDAGRAPSATPCSRRWNLSPAQRMWCLARSDSSLPRDSWITASLPLREFGTLFSAGAIPIIYSLVGVKVGAELSGILDRLRSREGGHA